ncbi:ATP phosphoribosyltransferase regulatory subunit, partial [Streptococcus thoraltensis]
FAPEIQKPVKMYYIGSMFRYERPQARRLREFHQIGVEAFGSSNPATDVETIAMAYQLFTELGIKDVVLHLNSLGNTSSRQAYRQALIDYLTPMRDSLSKDSQRRLEENPLRVLDSKEKEDKLAVENAPSILDFLDDESQAHFDEVRAMLEALNIPYVIDTNMVRGLNYYNHTIFEFITTIEKSELTICAGGR